MLQPRLATNRWLQLSAIGAIGFLAVWTSAALSGLTSRDFLPTPWDVLQRFMHLVREPFSGATLGMHLLSSLQRFGMGFGLAALVGVPLGLLMARFAALWFGTGIGGPVLIIFMGAFPPVLINTYRGARQVDLKYIEAAQMLGASHWRAMTQVMLPATVPSIVAGLRISAGLGWQSLVGAELIVASSGVGYLMVKGQAAISTATVMSGMLAIGVVGVIIDAALRRVQLTIETRRGL